jgi:hypothetical protein
LRFASLVSFFWQSGFMYGGEVCFLILLMGHPGFSWQLRSEFRLVSR